MTPEQWLNWCGNGGSVSFNEKSKEIKLIKNIELGNKAWISEMENAFFTDTGFLAESPQEVNNYIKKRFLFRVEKVFSNISNFLKDERGYRDVKDLDLKDLKDIKDIRVTKGINKLCKGKSSYIYNAEFVLNKTWALVQKYRYNVIDASLSFSLGLGLGMTMTMQLSSNLTNSQPKSEQASLSGLSGLSGLSSLPSLPSLSSSSSLSELQQAPHLPPTSPTLLKTLSLPTTAVILLSAYEVEYKIRDFKLTISRCHTVQPLQHNSHNSSSLSSSVLSSSTPTTPVSTPALPSPPTPTPTTTKLSTMTALKTILKKLTEDVTYKLVVILMDDVQLGPKTFFIKKIIVDDTTWSISKTYLEQDRLDPRVRVYSYSEFLEYPYIKPDILPHYALTEQQIMEIEARTQTSREQFPHLLLTDRICRWHRFVPGQVVATYRVTVEGHFESVRIVVFPKVSKAHTDVVRKKNNKDGFLK